MNTVPTTKIHSSLSPRTNVLLICIWTALTAFSFLVLSPHLPFGLGVVGGLLGSAAGIFQHLSIKQNPAGFLSASSLMEVRRGLTSNRWGRTYIASIYSSKVILAVLAYALIRTPLYRVVLGYVVAYVSFMLVRDVLTLKDTFVLRTLKGRSAPETAG